MVAAGFRQRCRGAACSIMIGAVRAYQLLLSPWLGARCRHLPTCSTYTIEAIRRFGPLTGGWLGAKRLSRCHPWGSCGYDPVPGREDSSVRRQV
jgi:uncharacterized protein